jgi:hypothetical protein
VSAVASKPTKARTLHLYGCLHAAHVLIHDVWRGGPLAREAADDQLAFAESAAVKHFGRAHRVTAAVWGAQDAFRAANREGVTLDHDEWERLDTALVRALDAVRGYL